MTIKSILKKLSPLLIVIISLSTLNCTVVAPNINKNDLNTIKAIVEVEETVYAPKPANNGADPLWNYGSPLIVRHDETVFISGLETLPNLKPLNNCRCLIYKRNQDGWSIAQADDDGRQREPCPIGIFDKGQLWLSSNPTITALNTYSGPSDPQLIKYIIDNPKSSPTVLHPPWLENPGFSEHSYRGIATDGSRAELFLTNIYMYDKTYWCFLDKKGEWLRGVLLFPESDYPDKQPTRIRLCYPEIALRNRAVHYFAVSDIIEPNLEWQKYKYELSKQHWDYDFRRLFYTWTPDIAASSFAPFVEIANREKTGGKCWNLDLWIASEKDSNSETVFLLWLEESIDMRLRPKFVSPDTPWTKSIHACTIRRGKIISKDVLEIAGEGKSGLIPQWGRFHATPDGRLYVIYYCAGKNEHGKQTSENRIMEIYRNGGHSTAIKIPLKHPFNKFMLATERGGSLPSNIIDVLGYTDGKPGINYARIRL